MFYFYVLSYKKNIFKKIITIPIVSLLFSEHFIEDEEILLAFLNTLSKDGIKLENLDSLVIELHDILIAFGQTSLALNSAHISSPPLMTHNKNAGFIFSKDGRFSRAY